MIDNIARIGFIGGEYEVFVKTDDEESNPNFHIKKKASQDYSHSLSLAIEDCRYLNNQDRKLDKESMIKLVRFLNRKCFSKVLNCSNWQLILIMWDFNNPNSVDQHSPMPDYMSLAE